MLPWRGAWMGVGWLAFGLLSIAQAEPAVEGHAPSWPNRTRLSASLQGFPDGAAAGGQFRKEMLVLDVEEGAISVTQVIFPAGAVDRLNFSVPRGAKNIELQNGFTDPEPTSLDDTRYFAKVEPGAMPLIVRYQVRTLGRGYRFEKSRDTDATDLKIFASHLRPAPKVTDARFDGLESMGQGLYYSFVVDASKRNEPLVIEFSRLPLNPIYLRLLTVAFAFSLAVLFLKKREKGQS